MYKRMDTSRETNYYSEDLARGLESGLDVTRRQRPMRVLVSLTSGLEKKGSLIGIFFFF